MIIELTEKLIKDAFAEMGIDQKYYSQYEAEVKRHYEALQKDCPDDEESTDEDNNALASLRITNEYMAYYVDEIEKGHSPQWSHEYAYYSVLEEDEDSAVSIAAACLEEEEIEKELRIHASAINKDSVFVERFLFLFGLGEQEVKKKAQDYCYAYHRCVEQGKSEIYAHAYADAVNEDYYNEFCEIYANAYECAANHGMDDGDAYLFGEFCTDAADQGYWTMLRSFKEKYKEDWQRDFYLRLIKQDYEDEKKRSMTNREFDELMKDVFG